MSLLYEDLAVVREDMHKLKALNMRNKFVEHISEQTGQYVDYEYPVIESLTSLIDKDIAFLDNLGVILKENNEKFLNNYRAAAESTNPIGLVADKVKAKTINNGSLECINSEVINALKSNDIERVDDTIEKIAGNNCECFGKPVTSLMSCDGSDCLESVDITRCKLTRDDVAEAIAFIESVGDKVKDIKNKAIEKSKDTKMKLSSLRKDMDKSAKEACKKTEACCSRKAASECCMVAAYVEMCDMINHAEIINLESQLIEELKSARSIVAMTATHNPRNLRESVEWTDDVRQLTEFNFDNLIESVYNTDLTDYIQEQLVNEAFEDIKSKMVLNNKKFLRKYQDAALKSNCEGIMMKKYYVPVTGLEAKMNKIIKDLDKMCNDAIKTNDVDKLKANLKKFRGTFLLSYLDGEATIKNAEMIGNGSVALVKNIAVKTETNHKVTKQDVKFAVNYLKDVDRRIDEAEREYNKISGAISMAIYTPNRTLGRDKDERIIKKIISHKRDCVENVQFNYRKIILTQLKVMQAQCRKVIMLAARQKANESDMKDLEELDSLLEQLFQ